ncbi:hypothetical protein ABT213_09740 [Streptomyces sp. NPDC001674]|uniref:hypothetical protein n=1 Tax=Streptomyces sp. NPDC001674 TaxID=3154394 RepID=UPI0033182C33
MMSNLARSLFIAPAVAIAFTTAALTTDLIDWPTPGKNGIATVAGGGGIDWPAPGARTAEGGASGNRGNGIDWPAVTVRT